jgi:hypothetical protein
MLDKVLTVKYAQREDGDRRGRRSSPIRRVGMAGLQKIMTVIDLQVLYMVGVQ